VEGITTTFNYPKTKIAQILKRILLFKIIVKGLLLTTTQDKMKTKGRGILDWRWWVELSMIKHIMK
jgi:hypothetical protein